MHMCRHMHINKPREGHESWHSGSCGLRGFSFWGLELLGATRVPHLRDGWPPPLLKVRSPTLSILSLRSVNVRWIVETKAIGLGRHRPQRSPLRQQLRPQLRPPWRQSWLQLWHHLFWLPLWHQHQHQPWRHERQHLRQHLPHHQQQHHRRSWSRSTGGFWFKSFKYAISIHGTVWGVGHHWRAWGNLRC